MSTVYNDYYAAYDSGAMNLDDIIFGVKLCDETYIPDSSHKPSDVTGIIVDMPSILWRDVIETTSMDGIVNKLTSRLLQYIENFPEEINPKYAMKFQGGFMSGNPRKELRDLGAKYFVVYYPTLDILCFNEEIGEI